MDRRQFTIAAVGFAVLAPTALTASPAFAAPLQIKVYKSPTCSCCAEWMKHLTAEGFSVTSQDLEQEALTALKKKSGLTDDLTSCHTGFINGYFLEGHVPASDIRRLLAERPDALGLTVPGMPIGSPGMEVGDTKETFDTLLVKRGGATTVFQRHA